MLKYMVFFLDKKEKGWEVPAGVGGCESGKPMAPRVVVEQQHLSLWHGVVTTRCSWDGERLTGNYSMLGGIFCYCWMFLSCLRLRLLLYIYTS